MLCDVIKISFEPMLTRSLNFVSMFLDRICLELYFWTTHVRILTLDDWSAIKRRG